VRELGRIRLNSALGCSLRVHIDVFLVSAGGSASCLIKALYNWSQDSYLRAVLLQSCYRQPTLGLGVPCGRLAGRFPKHLADGAHGTIHRLRK
jgi:hypothetical protein